MKIQNLEVKRTQQVMKIIGSVALTTFMLLASFPSRAQVRAALSEEAIGRINEVTEGFAKGVRAGNWKAVAALYIEDGVLYPPGEAAVKGRTAIEVCLAALPATTDFTLRTTRVEGHDDLAYVQGTYTMTLATSGTAASAQQSGYFLEVRRRQADGRWLIAVQMLNAHN